MKLSVLKLSGINGFSFDLFFIPSFVGLKKEIDKKVSLVIKELNVQNIKDQDEFRAILKEKRILFRTNGNKFSFSEEHSKLIGSEKIDSLLIIQEDSFQRFPQQFSVGVLSSKIYAELINLCSKIEKVFPQTSVKISESKITQSPIKI